MVHGPRSAGEIGKVVDARMEAPQFMSGTRREVREGWLMEMAASAERPQLRQRWVGASRPVKNRPVRVLHGTQNAPGAANR